MMMNVDELLHLIVMCFPSARYMHELPGRAQTLLLNHPSFPRSTTQQQAAALYQ